MDLERFRSYLVLLARLKLDKTLRSKLDASNVVQQTLPISATKAVTLRNEKDRDSKTITAAGPKKLTEQSQPPSAKALAAIFDQLDSQVARNLLQQMHGTGKVELTAQILLNMNEGRAAAAIARNESSLNISVEIIEFREVASFLADEAR